MNRAMVVIGGLLLIAGTGLSFESSTDAARFTSPNYTIDASIDNSFGGDTSGGNYQLTSSGGESIVGNGQGGSYVLDQGYAGQLAGDEPYIELSLGEDGLVSHYKFNETDGYTAHDSSANEKDATVHYSPVPKWSPGKIGNALSLDMFQDEYAELTDVSHLPSENKMTVMTWFKQDELEPNRALVSHWDYAALDGSWALQTEAPGGAADGSRLYFFVALQPYDNGDNYVKTGAGVFAAGEYYHAAIVYDGTVSNTERVKVYINGEQVPTQTTGQIATDLADTDSPLRVGDFKGLSRYFNGDIDNLKIFDRALSAAEIQQQYADQNSGNDGGSELEFGTVIPGSPKSAAMTARVDTNASAYGLSIASPNGLQSGSHEIPPLSASIESPTSWTDGETVGLGFSVASGPALDPRWQNGTRFAGVPSEGGVVYSQSLAGPIGKESIAVQFRLDVEPSQVTETYSGLINFTATTTP